MEKKQTKQKKQLQHKKAVKGSEQIGKQADSNNAQILKDSVMDFNGKITLPRDEGDGESVSEYPTECRSTFNSRQHRNLLYFNVEVDMVSTALFIAALATRFYRLTDPRNIVFDELHYGKYVGLYMRQTFFFDSHPPLGKQLIAAVAYFANFDGSFKFDRIGSPYSQNVPLFALRCVPAICGSLIIPVAYHIMLELGCKQWTAILASFLLLCDNALLTQSRFILMEAILIFFALFGLYCTLQYVKLQRHTYSFRRWFWLILSSVFLTCAVCVKYAGWYSWCLAGYLIWRDFWKNTLANRNISNATVVFVATVQCFITCAVSVVLYLLVFYIHLSVLYKAGPHDSVMTSAFQASLEGGLASITKGQPLQVAHGSQVTLRHTHGRTCWLHSHTHVYPLRYSDKRGSSHQQQVTCYTFKDVNNWWIIKRPSKNNLVVSEPVDLIRHGDIIQLVHGITSRALNTHDVAAPVSPHNQEVSCYIDYNVSMPAQNLWKVDITNRDQTGDVWLTIQSLVRLVHVNSSQALKFSGRQLPDWGFHQHEIVSDKIIQQEDTVWNIEEHRYTKSDDEKERERDMVNAEMIPLRATVLSFWDKFFELQYKMLFTHQENVQNHMYSSEPIEWPLMSRGIAYWVSSEHNGQVHLVGNIVVWYSGVFAVFTYIILVVFYLLRRRRLCNDLTTDLWLQFEKVGEVLLVGYLLHYIPFFFVDRTLFLHQYLPALIFKTLLASALIEHISTILQRWRMLRASFYIGVCCWVLFVFYVFRKFCVLSYGTVPLSALDVVKLRWKDTWDFIIHKQ